MLELGLCPIRYLIKKKRILYFHKLIKSDEKNIAKRVFEKQWETPLKGDFAAYLKQDLNEIGIVPNTVFTFKEYSKDQFKRLISTKINKAALNFLLNEKNNMKKGKSINHNHI